MSDNLRHWDALRKTDPKHTKGFTRAGGFKGTAIKPIYMAEKMTEHFGPCGKGWGMQRPEFTTMTVGDEILVYCTVALWYYEASNGTAQGTVYGVGGDKVAVKRKDGGVVADDEAFKKAYTDALSNAMKQLGVGADVHMGLFEDQKYLAELRQEFAENDEPTKERSAPRRQSKGKYELLSATGDVAQAFDDPMDWYNAVREALMVKDAKVVAIWENNKDVARNLENANPEFRWQVRGNNYHPIEVLERMVEKLAPGIAA